jgi:hypothetical protein
MADRISVVHCHAAFHIMGMHVGVMPEENRNDFGPPHHYRTHQDGPSILSGGIHVGAFFNQKRCQSKRRSQLGLLHLWWKASRRHQLGARSHDRATHGDHQRRLASSRLQIHVGAGSDQEFAHGGQAFEPCLHQSRPANAILGIDRHTGIEKAFDSLYADIFASQAMPSAYCVPKCVSGKALAIGRQQGRDEHKSPRHQSKAKLVCVSTRTSHERQTTSEHASLLRAGLH